MERFEKVRAELDSTLDKLKRTTDERQKRQLLQTLRRLLAKADGLALEPLNPVETRMALGLEVFRAIVAERESD